MVRRPWDDLPAAVRAAIEREAGPVVRAEIPSAGRNSDFSAVLHLADGSVFCKGISEADGNRGRMHRHEADVNEWLPAAVAPRLRWRTEVDGWLLLGFDHVPGRHADLTPGFGGPAGRGRVGDHADHRPGPLPGPNPAPGRTVARLAAWRGLAKDTPDDLAHTDLHPLNIHRAELTAAARARARHILMQPSGDVRA